jgi:hypothetical protein
MGFENEFEATTLGMLRHLDGPWSAGFSLSWANHRIRNDGATARFDGDLFSAAVSLKWEQDGARLALALAGGGGDFAGIRQIGVAGPGVQGQIGQSSVPVTFLDAGIRASQYFTFGRAYVRPAIDADLSYVRLGAFAEGGAGAIGSRFSSTDNLGLSVRPSAEAGFDAELAGGFGIRPWVKLGANWRIQSDFRLPSSFIGSVPTAGSYDQTIESERFSTLVSAGFDLYRGSSFGLRITYESEFGETFDRQSGRIAFSVQF